MQAKKQGKKPEVQQELPEAIDPLLVAQEELKVANELIATLQSENVKLLESSATPIVALSAQQLTRADVVKSLLPQVRLPFAQADIQSVKQTADAICHAFSIKS